MARSLGGQLLDTLVIDRAAKTPLFRQLDAQLRQAVASRRLPAGTRLPGTRQLAKELGVSRITVKNTYEQLVAEGYFRSVGRSGTYVAEIGAHNLSPTAAATPARPLRGISRLSARGARIAKTQANTRLGSTRPFRPGTPAMDLFPFQTWARLWNRQLRKSQRHHFGYGEPGGRRSLRQAIAGYLRDARAVNCDAEQIIITNGAQQAFILIALSLLDPGDRVLFEDPGHAAGRDVFAAAGLEIIPASIDGEGLDLSCAAELEPAPKLIFTTPSHQHPLGVTMSIGRRLELLAYAKRHKTWILEDDYDSEFRYSGRPISAMQGLDEYACVLYIGTFSKVLFQSIRLGYLVVPHSLVEPLSAAQVLICQSISQSTQGALADFINEGHFTAHLRKMRIAYAERCNALSDELRKQAGDILEVSVPEAGMHLIAWLPGGMCDRRLCESLWQAGIDALPLSMYCLKPFSRGGLILGFANTAVQDMASNVARLTEVLRETIISTNKQ